MPKLNVKEVIQREAKAQARKEEWRTIYEDCYEFALPQRNLYGGYYEGKLLVKTKPKEFSIVQRYQPQRDLLTGFSQVCFHQCVNGVD